MTHEELVRRNLQRALGVIGATAEAATEHAAAQQQAIDAGAELLTVTRDRRAEAMRVLEWLGEHGGNVVPFASHYIGIAERRELADAYADFQPAGGTE